ncbi:Ppx/GppA family phosphatase [Streptomyces sp. TRM66268-LWL]|uniref:Ppx/GppA family phosphatase n=1 Tax=Streptomyces polyasparticus TaxID=2767826 RepID=A0ABR7SG39_9ACTN|nr:Ppx/GppA family phosphatase [Streptomyces polyasparticus]MBC9713957.1 Ppx/GppA family phosphatase [Streptomyces polyasparticus]
MRTAVIDVGSNTVRLMVADVEGGAPLPVHTAKVRLRLAEHLGEGGVLPPTALAAVSEAVASVREQSERWGAPDPFAFATAVVRDAPNRAEVLGTVRQKTGVCLHVLPGEVEAELTFLGARRWMGWRAGPLAMLDIGGGSLEVAVGRGRLPEFAVSLPLGAGRLTREYCDSDDPPPKKALRAMRRAVRHQLRDVAARVRWESPRTSVAASRTFQQLARLCGAPPGRHGPFVRRELSRDDLAEAVQRLAALPASGRARLRGISAARSRQSLAGALVAHTVMELTGIDKVTISPWAVREGILLRQMEDGSGWWPALSDLDAGEPPVRPAELRVALPG